MELLFTTKRKTLKYEPPYFERTTDTEIVRPLVTVSSSNIIAFSSPTELTDTDGETWGGHVYVCDLATPWDAHKVTSTYDPVSSLEWDTEGNNLLIATTVGDVAVWTQKDYLLNKWILKYSASFPGEPILQSIFFHNGRRVVPLDKKTEVVISDRVQVMRAAPTLKGFGGVGQEGALILTSSGTISTVEPAARVPAGGGGVAGGAGEAGGRSARITAAAGSRTVVRASMAHSNGAILIAWLCRGGGGGGRVCCCRVSLTHNAILVTPLPGMSLAEPALITWTQRLEPESLLIAGTSLSLWKLSERSYPIHKLLSKPIPGSTTPTGQKSDCFNTLVWQQTWSQPCEGKPRAVCARNCTNMPAVVTNSTVYVADRQTVTCQIPLIDSEPPGASSPKKTKYANHGVVLCGVSWCAAGRVCVCVDTRAQLHALTHTHQHASPLSMQLTSNLLEYCLVAGTDPYDVLLTLKPDAVEPMYDRITESFQRQPAAFQQYYYQRWLTLRAALSRLSGDSRGGIGLLQASVCAWSAAAAAARIDDNITRLTPPHDIDKALSAIESKSDSTTSSSLQPLRHVVQRAADAAYTALTTLHLPTTNYDLSTDPQAILVLRKIAALARRDIPSRTLAKLAHRTHSQELVDECLSVSSQICNGVHLRDSLPRADLTTSASRHHIQLEYGVEPEQLRFTPETPNVDNAAPHNMDTIRYIYLGNAGSLRSCGRCGGKSLLTNTTHIHDSRYTHRCRCGGRWTLVSNWT